jgi:hypothetical protein
MSNAPMVLPFLNYTRFFVKMKRDFWKKASFFSKISAGSRQLLSEGLRLMGRVSAKGRGEARVHQKKRQAANDPASLVDQRFNPSHFIPN